MTTITVRNLPEETLRALRAQAARHGQSMEAEIRGIITENVLPGERIRLGDVLTELGMAVNLTEEEFSAFTSTGSDSPARAARFE